MAKRSAIDDLERVQITSISELDDWLREHHEQRESVWLVSFKKHRPERYVSWSDIVDALLAWGWIDSRARRLDENRSMRLLSPRKAGSPWSRVNKDKIERLEAEGRIRPPGRAVIERAKADGSWTVYDECEDLVVRPDLAKALADAKARDGWDALSPSMRRGILWWIKSAKRPATRAKRIATTAERIAAGVDVIG